MGTRYDEQRDHVQWPLPSFQIWELLSFVEHLRMRVERLNDFHLSLPESEEFLRADLTKDTSTDLAYAEQVHKKEDSK
jgi:hypothetical protein